MTCQKAQRPSLLVRCDGYSIAHLSECARRQGQSLRFPRGVETKPSPSPAEISWIDWTLAEQNAVGDKNQSEKGEILPGTEEHGILP
jgi:hypothetical protein